MALRRATAVTGGRALPTGPGQVAMTSRLASISESKWAVFGPRTARRRVVGIVQNPQSLLDEFALLAPGQISGPDPGHRIVRRPEVRSPLRSLRASRTCPRPEPHNGINQTPFP